VRTNLLQSGKVRVTLNKSQLQKEIFVGGSRIIQSKLTPIVQEKIDDAQKEMVQEFESHPISLEISAGNSASNTSGVLGGYGNLFSFIGFESGENQISELSNILRRKIPFRIRRINNRGAYSVVIQAPSKQELEATAQVSWMGGRSWLDGIERGIAGLNRYLYDPSYSLKDSRSGTGSQVQNDIRGVKQTRTSYVSKILTNFKNRLNRL
jgi:hypothetical protein